MKRKRYTPMLNKAVKERKPRSKGWGGKREGGGRPKGSRAKIDIEMDAYISQVMNGAARDGKSEPNALEIQQALYKDPKVPPHIRNEASIRCLSYEAARIAPTEMTDPNGGTFQSRISAAAESLKGKLHSIPAGQPAEQISGQPVARGASGT